MSCFPTWDSVGLGVVAVGASHRQREGSGGEARCHRRLRQPLPARRPQARPRRRRREDPRRRAAAVAAHGAQAPPEAGRHLRRDHSGDPGPVRLQGRATLHRRRTVPATHRAPPRVVRAAPVRRPRALARRGPVARARPCGAVPAGLPSGPLWHPLPPVRRAPACPPTRLRSVPRPTAPATPYGCTATGRAVPGTCAHLSPARSPGCPAPPPVAQSDAPAPRNLDVADRAHRAGRVRRHRPLPACPCSSAGTNPGSPPASSGARSLPTHRAVTGTRTPCRSPRPPA